jgi:hypothetical protein
MTYHEDPNIPRRPVVRDEKSYAGWVLAGIAALAIAAVLMFAFSDKTGTRTATENTNRPAATQPASPASSPSTTGSAPTVPVPANR